MKIRNLRMDFDKVVTVEVWVNCDTQEDCSALIEWLQLAKANMQRWEKINARASRAAKASAGEDETSQPRQIHRAA